MAIDADLRARPRWTPGFIGEAEVGLEGVRRELYRLADYLAMPAVDGVQFVIQTVMPERPREGVVMWFAPNVHSVGSAAGLWQYAGGIWKAL